jgi:hypothetical protein
MQIHELTKRNLKEASIIDKIKSGASAVKTGVQNIQAQAAAANVAQGQAQQDKTQAQAARYAEILRKQGYTGQTSATPTSSVAAGQRILVQVPTQNNPNGPKANYYKTSTGWENELNQPVTNPTSVAYLEKIYATQVRPAGGTVRPTTAGAVQTGGAGAVMTGGDIDQAIRQLGLTTQQLQAFQTQATQNPGFVQAFLKRLGLVR